MIRRRGHGQEEEDSSSEEEDAFSALSRKSNKRQKSGSNNQLTNKSSLGIKKIEPAKGKPLLPVSLTSSMKRHHKTNEERNAKMDALLQELEAEKNKIPKDHRFVPEKKGSFVEPSEEHLTTNIFVGNLAPSITEEDITDLFLKFGELYSVKIMWPRTPAEKSRKRNTGFVCFMNREDAEEAMESCNERDPFNVGRLLMMRWGKNVKKNVRYGAGGLSVHSRKKNDPNDDFSDTPGDAKAVDDFDEASMRSSSLPHVIQCGGSESKDISKAEPYHPAMHSSDAIRVELPDDPNRFHFISTVASYVARDGSGLERSLIQTEQGNPLFNFLTLTNAGALQAKEYIFYRWRVYSFCQGDRYSEWRTEPFVMFHPQGRYWIPPPLNKKMATSIKTQSKTARKKDSQANPEKKDFLTGRQFERAMGQIRKGNRRGLKKDGTESLTTQDMNQFEFLVKRKLSISRESICRAMAFCFEKSGSAKEIVALLKEALLDETPSTTVDVRIARLYLISDILFNSQQPGVKNAFMYRDALEKMAPEIFTTLGKHGGNNVGRMTMNKLRKAVSTVLGAWTEWSVYNPAFLDELEARFEGREVKEAPTTEPEAPVIELKEKENIETKEDEEIIINGPRGGWTEVDEDADESSDSDHAESSDSVNGELMDTGVTSDNNLIVQRFAPSDDKGTEDVDGYSMEGQPIDGEDLDGAAVDKGGSDKDDNVDGDVIDGDQFDGEAIDGDQLDGDAIDGDQLDGDAIDGDQLDGDAIDGDQLDGDAIDGDQLDGEDVDGGQLDGEDIDGGQLDGDDIDGGQLDGEDIDGGQLDGEDIDGGQLDGEDIDGGQLDGEDIDGGQLDGEDIDGGQLDGEDIDGDEYVDESPMDRKDIHGRTSQTSVVINELQTRRNGKPHSEMEREKTIENTNIDGDPVDGESLDGVAMDGDVIDGSDLDGDDLDGEEL